MFFVVFCFFSCNFLLHISSNKVTRFCHALLVICKCTMQNKMCWCIYHFISAAVLFMAALYAQGRQLERQFAACSPTTSPPAAQSILRNIVKALRRNVRRLGEREKMNVSRLWCFSTWLWLNKNGVHLTAVNGVRLHTTSTCDWGKHCMHRQFSLSDYIPPVLDIIFQIWVCLSCSYFVNVTDL